MSSSGNNVNVRMTAQSAGAEGAWMSLINLLNRYEQKLQNLGKAGSASSRKIEGSLQRATKQIGVAVRSIVGIGSALQGVSTFASMVRKELQLYGEVNTGALDFQNRFSRALEAVNQQLPSRSPELMDMTPTQISEALVNRSQGLDPVMLAQAFSTALSANLDQKVSVILESILSTVKLRRDLTDPDQLSAISEGGQALFRAGGGTMEGRIAQVLAAQPASRTVDAAAFAKNIAPAAAQLAQNFNMSVREALAQLIAIGAASEDREGNITRTNAILFNTQLKIMAMQRGLANDQTNNMDLQRKMVAAESGPLVELRKELLGAFERGIIDDAAKREALQKGLISKKDLKDLELGIEGRAVTKMALIGLVRTGDTLPRRLQAEAFKQIGTQEEAIESRKQVAALSKGGIHAAREVQLERDAFKFRRFSRPEFAMREQALQITKEMAKFTGGSAVAAEINQKIRLLQQAGSSKEMTEVLSEIVEMVQQRAEELDMPRLLSNRLRERFGQDRIQTDPTGAQAQLQEFGEGLQRVLEGILEVERTQALDAKEFYQQQGVKDSEATVPPRRPGEGA